MYNYRAPLTCKIWNNLVSERIEKLGSRVVAGDLISFTDQDEDVEANPEVNELEQAAESLPTPSSGVCQSIITATEEGALSLPYLLPNGVSDVKLTKYSFAQVVMPLPGHAVQYPKHCVGIDSYTQLLQKDGITLDDFKSKHKAYCLSGGYRRIVEIPKDVSWRAMRYDDPEERLSQSDFDTLHGNTLVYKESGQYQALLIQFSLRKSAYATMCYRELLKHSTSLASQMPLNKP